MAMRYLLFLSAAKYCGLRVCVSARGTTEENREDGERGIEKGKRSEEELAQFRGLEQR